MRRNRKQADLFPGAAIGQRRYVTPEPADLYRAIVRLREAGAEVYRAGKLHKVNGCLRTDYELKRLAGACR